VPALLLRALRAVHRSLVGHRSNCLSLEFHVTGPFLITGSQDTNVKLWDLRRKEAIFTYKGHTTGVRKVATSPDGNWVCSGSDDGDIKVGAGGWAGTRRRACSSTTRCCRSDSCKQSRAPQRAWHRGSTGGSSSSSSTRALTLAALLARHARMRRAAPCRCGTRRRAG
jgi:WD40 repeat protein